MKQDGYQIVSEAIDKNKKQSKAKVIVSGVAITGATALAILALRYKLRPLLAKRDSVSKLRTLQLKLKIEKLKKKGLMDRTKRFNKWRRDQDVDNFNEVAFKRRADRYQKMHDIIFKRSQNIQNLKSDIRYYIRRIRLADTK